MSTSSLNKRPFKKASTLSKVESISPSQSSDDIRIPPRRASGSRASSAKKVKKDPSRVPKAKQLSSSTSDDDIFKLADSEPTTPIRNLRKGTSPVPKSEKLSPSPSKDDVFEISDDAASPKSFKKIKRAPKPTHNASSAPKNKVVTRSEDEEGESSAPPDVLFLGWKNNIGLSDTKILDIMSGFVTRQNDTGLPLLAETTRETLTERWWDEIVTGAMIQASNTDHSGSIILSTLSRIVGVPAAKAQAKQLLVRALTKEFKQLFGVKKWDKKLMLNAITTLSTRIDTNAKRGCGTYLSAYHNGDDDVMFNDDEYDLALSCGASTDSFRERFSFHDQHTSWYAKEGRERYSVADSCLNRPHVIVSDLTCIKSIAPIGAALVYQSLTKLQELAEIAFFRSTREPALLSMVDIIRPGDMPTYQGILGLNKKNPLNEFNAGKWSDAEQAELISLSSKGKITDEELQSMQALLLAKHGTMRSVQAIRAKLAKIKKKQRESLDVNLDCEELYEFALRQKSNHFKLPELDCMIRIISQVLSGSRKVGDKVELANFMRKEMALSGFKRTTRAATIKMEALGIEFSSWSEARAKVSELKSAKAVITGQKMRLLGRTPTGAALLPRDEIEDSLYPEERQILTQQFRAHCESSSYDPMVPFPVQAVALECQRRALKFWKTTTLAVEQLAPVEWQSICGWWSRDDDLFSMSVREKIHKEWELHGNADRCDTPPKITTIDIIDVSDGNEAAIRKAEARQSKHRRQVANKMRRQRAKAALKISNRRNGLGTVPIRNQKNRSHRGRSGSFLLDDTDVDLSEASDEKDVTDGSLESDGDYDTGEATPNRKPRTRKQNSAPLKLDPQDGDIRESSDSDFKPIKAKPKQHWRDRVNALDSKRDVSPKFESDNEQDSLAFRPKTKVEDDCDGVSRVVKHEAQGSNSRRRSKQTIQQPLGGLIPQKRSHSTVFAKSEDSDSQVERPEPDIIDLTSSPPVSKPRKLFSRKTNKPASCQHQSSSNDGFGRNYPQSSTSASFTPRSRLQASRSSYSYESLEDMETAKAIERARQVSASAQRIAKMLIVDSTESFPWADIRRLS